MELNFIKDAMNWAAKNGHLEVVAFLKQAYGQEDQSLFVGGPGLGLPVRVVGDLTKSARKK